MENLLHRFILEFEKSIPALVIASCGSLVILIGTIILKRTRKDPGNDVIIISFKNGKDKHEIWTTRRELHSPETLRKIRAITQEPDPQTIY